MPDSVNAQYERLFDKLFTLIRDNTASTQKLVSEVGKHRANVNELIALAKNRPCFEETGNSAILHTQEHAIQRITEVTKKKGDEHIKSLSGANDKLVKLLWGIFLTLVIVNTSIFGGILFFVHKNPQIWEIVKVLIQNGGK